MKKYTFLVYHTDFNEFLSALRNKGVVHISLKSVSEEEDEALQKHLQKKSELTRILKQGASDELVQAKSETEQKLKSLTKEKEKLSAWGDFTPKKIELLRKAGCSLRFFECPKKLYDESWGIKMNNNKDSVLFISTTNDEFPHYCVEYNMGSVSLSEMEKQCQEVSKKLTTIYNQIDVWKKENASYLQDELNKIEKNIEWQKVKLSSTNVVQGAVAMIEGYCPLNDSLALNEYLDKETNLTLYYQCTDPQTTDTPPIKLRNNRFIRLFEPLTNMYGLPDYKEFDPTPILGPFFLLFFSLCIGDAGYGLLLILIGFLIHKRKLNIEMFKGLGPIIMALGGGSTIIGYLMGTFFGIDLFSVNWLPEQMKVVMFKNWGDKGKIGEYDIMMILALIVGVIHICLAMIVKAIAYTKNRGFKETISTWSWLLLIIGSIVITTLWMGKSVSQNTAKLSIISLGAVSAVGIFIFNNPERNPLINIGAGLWDTYGMITGLLGDVLSYIRLYALGLAGGMLGMAFNQLGEMVLGENPNIGTAIGFILIVTFGHILNLLMACLGAFVHPLRLTFVEYFKNAGYQGTGKKYKPFKV